MSRSRSVCLVTAFLLSISAAVSAHSAAQDPLPLDLSIDAHHVRFATHGSAVDWRLEVADQQGQAVYDSQFETGSAIDWALVDGQGQDVDSGLYSYTLSIRAGSDKVRTRKGLLLVQKGNRGYDVRAVSDQQSALASDGETSVTVTGGAESSNGSGVNASSGGGSGAIPTNLGNVSFVSGQGFISGTGTTNSMTKWADGPAGVVADTNVTEVNASVVVGNGTFRGNLQIFGPANKDVFAGMGPNLITGPGFNFGYAGETFGQSAGFFNVRPDGSAVAPNPSLRFMTANNQRMIITNTGDVAIGITAPQFGRLQVVNADNTSGQIQVGANVAGAARKIISFGDRNCAGAECVYVGEEDMDDRLVLKFRFGGIMLKTQGFPASVVPETDNAITLGGASNRFVALFAVNGTIQTSDERMKRAITNLNYGLNALLKLRPVSFEWKNNSDGRRHLGLIAQEVDAVVPEAVYRDANPDTPLGMNYNDLLPVVIKAVQEQQVDAEQKSARIEKLEAENAALRERLAAVEAALQQLLGLKKNQ